MRDPLKMSSAGGSLRVDSPDRGSVVLALEVARLATDEQDCAVRREVMADWEAVSADWPA
jgi:hypothetical protein